MSEAEEARFRIEQEIDKIKDANLQDFLKMAINHFPEYFWTAPASAGKYHYPDERERGGLVLHVRRLCALVPVFTRMHDLNMWEQDILYAACILHDAFSRGIPPNDATFSLPFHPLLPRQQFPFNGVADRYIPSSIYEEIMECVESHLGRWSPSPLLHSKRKLPTIFQMIDHIGSRPNIKVEL